MKKIGKVILLSVISVSLMTGCFPNERSGLIKDAKSSYVDGDLDTALEYLSKAKRIEDFSNKADEKDISEMYKNIVNTLYVDYITAGNNAYKIKNYEEALLQYNHAYNVYPSDAKLVAKIKEVQILKQKQKDLNTYIVFFSEVLNDSNSFLRALNNQINYIYLGKSTQNDLSQTIKESIPLSSSILNRFDGIYNEVDKSLYNIHNSLMDLVNYQHQTLIDALGHNRDSLSVEEISTKYKSIKRKQSSLIQQLKQFADNNKLKAEIIIEVKKENEQSTPFDDEINVEDDFTIGN